MSVSTLVTTVGATLNAYCSVTFADQYHNDRPPVGETWLTASPDAKAASILWATKLLDALYAWNGFVTDSAQPLQWPRQAMMQRNGLALVASTVIPLELQQACAEYARQLLVADRVGDSDIESQKLRSLSVGSVSMSFDGGVTAKQIPDAVFFLLPPSWGYPRGRSTGMRSLVRS